MTGPAGAAAVARRPSIQDLSALGDKIYAQVADPGVAAALARGSLPPADDEGAAQILAATSFISRHAPGALRGDEVGALGAAVATWCSGGTPDWSVVGAILGDVERRLLDGGGGNGTEAWPAPPPKQPLAEVEKSRETQAGALVRLVAGAELFHDNGGTAWATVQVSGHRESHRVRAKGFRTWLARRFYQECGKPPGAQALQDAVGVIEAQALFDGPEMETHLRVAAHGGKVYVDLGNPAWQAVEVDGSGWRVVSNPPVRFWRPKSMLPLPEPVRGGSLLELRRFIPCDDECWVLYVAWLVGALAPRGPYPILAAEGEQGSGKSTACRIARALVDPAGCALRRPPREERDLFIAARNGWVVGYGNLSGIPDWLSDALCVLSTGGGYAARQLYSDDEEAVLAAQRPVIVNGIDQVGVRSDFRDRCLRVVFPEPLEDSGRAQDEQTLWAEFEAVRPRILGALLDAVSCALKRWDEVRGVRLPRMADFARWVMAAEPVLPWEPGTFLRVYTGQRASMAREAVEDSPLAQAIVSVVEDAGGCWRGTATELLAAVAEHVDEATRRGKTWPQTPRALAGRLRRMAPDLRRGAGIDAEFLQTGHERARTIIMQRIGADNRPHRPHRPQALSANGFAADGAAEAKPPYRPQPSAYRPQPSAGGEPESLAAQGFQEAADGADGADAKLPLLSTMDSEWVPPGDSDAPPEEEEEVGAWTG